MAGKRQRQEAHEEPDAAEPATAQEQRNDASTRRDGMASVARRRAAHFAHFNDDDAAGDANVHVGSDKARTLGPWSSAMELVNARDKAQQDRQEKLKGAAAEDEQEDDAALLAASWQPQRDPALGPHPRDVVQPLFELCLGVLTEYVDCVESLWGVPDAMKVRLAAHVSARRKMSPEVAQLFAAAAPSEVQLPDCTQLDARGMGELMKEVATSRLQRLELGFCGRGFGDEAAAVLAAAGPLGELEVLALEGAYRLTDAGLGKALSAAPRLAHLAVPQGSRLTGATLERLLDLAPKLSHLNLADCRGIGADSLAAALPRLTSLRALILDLIPEVDDTVLGAAATLPELRELSIRCCQSVTDAGLAALAATRGSVLEVLRLDECGGKVTDAGIAGLATHCRALRVFSARRCTRLGDEALAELFRVGTVRHLTLSGVPGVGPAVSVALASCCREYLEHLDVSFCRKLPDRCMGLLLDRCSQLRRLVVFGCSQLTAKSLYGHTNADLVIEGCHTKADLDLMASRAAGRRGGAVEAGAAEAAGVGSSPVGQGGAGVAAGAGDGGSASPGG